MTRWFVCGPSFRITLPRAHLPFTRQLSLSREWWRRRRRRRWGRRINTLTFTDLRLESGTLTRCICGYPRIPRGVSIVEIGRELYVGSTLNPFARCEGCGDTRSVTRFRVETGILNSELIPIQRHPLKLPARPFSPAPRISRCRAERLKLWASELFLFTLYLIYLLFKLWNIFSIVNIHAIFKGEKYFIEATQIYISLHIQSVYYHKIYTYMYWTNVCVFVCIFNPYYIIRKSSRVICAAQGSTKKNELSYL